MQKITRRKLAEYLADQLHAGKSPQHIARQAASYLVEQRQTDQLELLVRDIEDVLATKYRAVSAHITTAHALDVDTRKQLADFIKQTEQAQSVIVASEVVDTDLIGGVIIQTPAHTFDSSVRNKLKQLVATTKG